MKFITKALLKAVSLINYEWYIKKLGVQIGRNCKINGRPNFGTEPYLVSIGNHVLIAGGGTAFITHEGGHWVLKGMDKKYNSAFGFGRITVEDNVYIGYRCIILRGVTIGKNTIIGAGSLVNKSCLPNSVYAGVPAKRICSLDEWKQKFMSEMPIYDEPNFKKNKKNEILKIVDSFPRR